MAGTTKKGKGGKVSASYSTRFDSKQRALIEEAATVANCSPAKLIREAAVVRAADIVNAQGGAGKSLRVLAAKVVQQVSQPALEVREWWEDEPEPQTRVVRDGRAGSDILSPSHEHVRIESVRCGSCDAHELRQIRSALETGGSEFVRILLELWEARDTEKPDYEPRVVASEVLRGGE